MISEQFRNTKSRTATKTASTAVARLPYGDWVGLAIRAASLYSFADDALLLMLPFAASRFSQVP